MQTRNKDVSIWDSSSRVSMMAKAHPAKTCDTQRANESVDVPLGGAFRMEPLTLKVFKNARHNYLVQTHAVEDARVTCNTRTVGCMSKHTRRGCESDAAHINSWPRSCTHRWRSCEWGDGRDEQRVMKRKLMERRTLSEVGQTPTGASAEWPASGRWARLDRVAKEGQGAGRAVHRMCPRQSA